MFEFLQELRSNISRTREDLYSTVKYFYSLSLLKSYFSILDYALDGMRTHPEVAKVPEYEDFLIRHFQLYPLQHIKLSNNRIFDLEFIGSVDNLFDWQEAGYPLERGDDSYDKRLNIFKSIWEGTPITVTIDRVTKKGKRIQYKWTFQPRNPKTRDIATYEQIIEDRNAAYGNIVKTIPFFWPFNFGTGFLGSAGYPQVEGIFFLEKGQSRIEENNNYFESKLDSYLAQSLFDSRKIDVEAWAKSNITQFETYGVDIFSIAKMTVV